MTPRKAPTKGRLVLTFDQYGQVMKAQASGTAAQDFLDALLNRPNRAALDLLTRSTTGHAPEET